MGSRTTKGLEFPHVFVIKATRAWGESPGTLQSSHPISRKPQLQPAGATFTTSDFAVFRIWWLAPKTTLTTYSQNQRFGSDTIFLELHQPSFRPAIQLNKLNWLKPTGRRDQLRRLPRISDLLALLETCCFPRRIWIISLRGGPQNLLNNLPHSQNSPQLRNRDSQQPSQQAHCSFKGRSPIAKHRTNPSNFSKIPSRASICQRSFFTCIWIKREVGLHRVLKRQIFRFSHTDLAELDFSNQGVIIDNARLTGKSWRCRHRQAL